MSRRGWVIARFVGAAAVLAALVWHLGTGPFRDGIRALDGPTLAAAAGIGVLTTTACAWRWTVVARGLGLELPLPAAVAAYYRSIFLNLTLPGGIVGDVHRGVMQGRGAGDLGRGLRAVVWERAAGQAVQAVLTLAILLVLPSPVRGVVGPVAVALVAAGIGVAVLVARRRPRARLLPPRAIAIIAFTSALAVLGHAVAFLIAARAADVTAPPVQMLPLAMLAMLGMVVPGIAGWGPREGTAAWVFGAAGLGAGTGIATAVVYGVMALVAALPGALVLAGEGLASAVRTERVADA